MAEDIRIPNHRWTFYRLTGLVAGFLVLFTLTGMATPAFSRLIGNITLALARIDAGAPIPGTNLPVKIALVLLTIAAAVILFFFEWVPADITALGILLFLVITGLLPEEQAFSGFGSETVLMIFGLFILTAALIYTGTVDNTGRAILRYAGESPKRLLNVVIWSSAILGAFISNTASTAFFVPIVIGLANRLRLSASKFLLPLAFASILTSSVTLISTSTNIVISGLMTRYNQSPMGMFELAPVGIPIAIVGLFYLQIIGPRLLRNRNQSEDLGNSLGIRRYLTEILIPAESSLDGKTLANSGIERELDLTVLRIIRDNKRHLLPRHNRKLKAGDVLLVQGVRDEILKLKDIAGIDIRADVEIPESVLKSEEVALAEVVLLPRSRLIGKSLRRQRFQELHRIQVLALFRHGETVHQEINQIRLRVGDVLLVQGHPADISALEEEKKFSVIGEVDKNRSNVTRAPAAVAIFIGVLAVTAFNLISLPIAVLLGVLLAFLTRSISPEQAYREVDWRALILIGSMLGLGTAMIETGTADYLAERIVDLLGAANPLWLLTAFFGLAVLLTQPMSNQAAAIVVVPVAMQTAVQLNLNPRTFAMMIAVAASTSYMTPLEPACLMVYGPGGYRFADFLKVGAPLTVVIYILAILLVPLIWPLTTG